MRLPRIALLYGQALRKCDNENNVGQSCRSRINKYIETQFENEEKKIKEKK
jgi:hypothetical protein